MRLFEKSKKITVFIGATLVVVSLIALYVSFVVTNNLRDEIAVKQLEMLTERTEIENRTFFKELNTSLNTISGLVKSRIFAEANIDKWSAGILPVLQSNLNIDAVSVVDKDGEFVVSLNDSTLCYYFIKDQNESGTTYYSKDLSSDSIVATNTVISIRTINLNSYKNHISNNSDSIVWYDFESIPGIINRTGLAAVVKLRGEAGSDESIISIYVSLETVHDFIADNASNVNADIFLFTEDRLFLDFDNELNNSPNSNLSDYLVSWDKVQFPLYREAMLTWEKSRKNNSGSFQSFKYDGRKYWGDFRVTQRGNDNLWVALIVPEDDFSLILIGRFGLLFFSAIFVLLVAVVILVLTLRRNNTIVAKKDFLETDDVLKLIEKGENDFTEFKSTIRMNLFSKKPGKEIELAWLKSVVGFCNTKGGTILIGVNDDGEILGLDADLFQNDDKCLLHVQSLLKDHIGMEFTKYINYRLHSFGNKKFLAVHCTPSPKPLFLISNNKEQFYVRSGPASIELPLSKALKYIEDRKLV
jgi:hypothetical protein